MIRFYFERSILLVIRIVMNFTKINSLSRRKEKTVIPHPIAGFIIFSECYAHDNKSANATQV